MSSEDDFPIYPLIDYKDFSIWYHPLIEKDPERHFHKIKEMKMRPTDIFISTSPKTGTHWIHEIVSMLLSQTTEYNSRGDVLDAHIEFGDPEEKGALDDPRILHSCLPLSFFSTITGKIVYVNRNPKDRHVSMFNFLRGKNGVPEDWTWTAYFEKHVIRDTLLTGWFNYTGEMTAAVHDKSVIIIQLMYEDLLLKPESEIMRLAKFLDVPYTEQFIKDVALACRFDKLKDKKIDSITPWSKEGKSTLFRKGVIGDWKNYFTVAQNEQFDALYSKEMKDLDVKFTFEMPIE